MAGCVVAALVAGSARAVDPTFTPSPGSPFGVGDNPRAVAVADLDRDGKPDLVAANGGPGGLPGDVSILLAAGGGAFGSATSVAAGTEPSSVAVADLDRDGLLDLVVANAGSNDVTVLLATGGGAFGSATSVAAGTEPSSVAVADLDRDGILDLAVANSGSNDVAVLLGTGGGAFGAATSVAAGTNPISVAVADLNRDGLLDLAVANNGSADVTVALGTGGGAFALPVSVPAGDGPVSVVTADLDRDGKLDLAVANLGSDDISILLGDGAGGFGHATGSPILVGGAPVSVAAADVSRDGKPDLVVAALGGDVTVLLRDGDGGFSALTPLAAGINPYAVAAADLNGDGKPDLAIANSGSDDVTVLLNTTPLPSNPFLAPAPGSPFGVGPGSFPSSTALVDVDLDGKQDLAVAGQGGGVWLLPGDGAGGFGPAAGPFATGTTPYSVVAADFNRDGKPDLATANYDGANGATVLLGDGAGGFGSSSFSVGGDNPASIATVDLNRDGKLDLLTANRGSYDVSALLGDGAGGFSITSVTSLVHSGSCGGCGARSVAVGDVNRDGIPDVVVANLASDNVSVLLGNGAGGFTEVVGSPFAAGPQPIAAAVADLDADGALDLAVANSGSTTVSVLLGNGAGGFTEVATSPFTVGAGPQGIAVADVNADGKRDLAVPNGTSNNVSLLLGDGSGGFSAAAGSPFGLGGGVNPYSLEVGDVNEDGDPDFTVANNGSNDVTVLVGAAGPSTAVTLRSFTARRTEPRSEAATG